MKQIKTWLTTIATLLCSLTTSAHDFEVDGIYYNITDEANLTVTVTYRGSSSDSHFDSYSNEYSGAVAIPSTVTYNGNAYSVTSIGNDAFFGCSSLTSITIPDGVTSIGSSAFENCSSLTSITIPEGVTSIGFNAFFGCSSLTSITLPASLTSIGVQAFYKCSSLTSITIPEGVTSIESSAFNGCSSLTSITIPESVMSIEDYAFGNCTAIKKVIIEDGITTLSLGYNYYKYNGHGEGLFYDCPLEEVYLGRNLSYGGSYEFGYSPFYYKNTLTNVTIGNEVTEICKSAFYECNNIHSLTIGNGVLSIGEDAFSNPEKVFWLTNTPPLYYFEADGSINYVANDQYSNRSNVKIYPYLSSMFEVDGVKYVPVSPSERTCHAIDCAYDSTAAAINVSETVSFKGVTMKVTEVMPYTFYGNNHITEVAVSHLGNIGDYAFCSCDSIKMVTLGDGISSLGDMAFSYCRSLQQIVIPESVTSIGAGCFSSCSEIKNAVLGDGLINIKEYTFEKCTALVDVTVGDGVTVIGNYAFTGCSALPNVTLGRSVATINNYAFQNCSSLSEIKLPKSVTKVGDHVFAGCSRLADIIIEDRTTALALGGSEWPPLFANCPLDSVYIGGKITYSTANNEGYSPFYRNTSLRTVVITDREEQIYDNEFYGCTNLKNVTIGNGVKSIGDFAFSGCSSLDKFAFGSSMQHIGEEAFSDCTNLTEICSSAINPPTCGTQALDDINKWNCTLKVPIGYQSAYMTADQWKEFFFIEDVIDGVDQLIYDNSEQPMVIYDLNGRKVLDADKIKSGIYIVNGNKVFIK